MCHMVPSNTRPSSYCVPTYLLIKRIDTITPKLYTTLKICQLNPIFSKSCNLGKYAYFQTHIHDQMFQCSFHLLFAFNDLKSCTYV